MSALVLDTDQKTSLDTIVPYLEDAFADGTDSPPGTQIVGEMPGYDHPVAEPYKNQIKAAFLGTLAALIKSGVFSGGGGNDPLTAGPGLSGTTYDGSAPVTFAVDFGDSAGQAIEGDNVRLNPTPTTVGNLIYDNGSYYDVIAPVAAGSYLRSNGAAVPIWSTLILPNAATVGDLFYGSSANTMGRLADVATGSVLASGGVGVAPSYVAPNGDITGAIGAVTVTKIQNIDVLTGTPTNKQILQYVSANTRWEATTRSALTPGNGITGSAYDGTAPFTWNITYGTTANTSTQGNDTRLPPAPSAAGKLIYDTGAAYAALATVAAGSYLRSAGASAPVWSTLVLPNAATAGDLLYASSANTIGNLADVATGSVLASGGVGVAPSYIAPAGDVTGAIGANTVGKIQNVSVLTGTPSNLQVLQYITANTRWEPTAINNAPFGDGANGAVTIGAGTTTLTGEKCYTTLVVNGRLNTAGFIVRASVSITVNVGGVIDNDGESAVAAARGNQITDAQLGGGGNTANGGTGNGSNGGAVAAGWGGAGGAGGAGSGGRTGGNGGAATASNANQGVPRSIFALLTGQLIGGGTGLVLFRGGGGGGAGGGDGTNQAGASGSGAGVCLVLSPIIANSGRISANGGNGGSPAAGNCGGGGGGGGGYMGYLTRAGGFTGTTPTATGGTGGTKTGTGVNGTNGTNGNVIGLTI